MGWQCIQCGQVIYVSADEHAQVCGKLVPGTFAATNGPARMMDHNHVNNSTDAYSKSPDGIYYCRACGKNCGDGTKSHPCGPNNVAMGAWLGSGQTNVPARHIETQNTKPGPDWSAYAALSNERDLLKRRVEEMEGKAAVPGQIAISQAEYVQLCRSMEEARVARERVKVLEQSEEIRHGRYTGMTPDRVAEIACERAQEDLARKREECGRLEKQLTDRARICETQWERIQLLEGSLADANVEIAKLRRELRSKR